MTRLRAAWQNRPVYFHLRWDWGWTGNGWNALRLGPMVIWFASGPSPRERLKEWLS